MDESQFADLLQRLESANEDIIRQYPGESDRRQPVHTVYGGAHLFRSNTPQRLGELALDSLAEYAPDSAQMAEALEITEGDGDRIYDRIAEKLEREPVEDFRLDFEDGYGNRPDSEEDEHSGSAATAVAQGLADGTLPPFMGIRVKPLSADLKTRSLRTLDLFVTALVQEADGQIPDNFVVTLPKVTTPIQVAVLSEFLLRLENALGLSPGLINTEIMIETTQSIFGPDGHVRVRELVEASGGRCVAAHFGTYDYTASCNITAAHQHMVHPACDFARNIMQVALAGTGVWLSDGATNILPVPVHRGGSLTRTHRDQNRAAVHQAWRLHFSHIQHSLIHAYYQGWDLHPAQLVTRYAAIYDFFLSGLDAAAERLSNFVEQAAQATLVGEVFDDAATGQGLLNFFLRAINSGAISEGEAAELSTLSVNELQSRSFVGILAGRRSS